MTLLIIALTPLLLAFWAQSKVGILAALIFALALLLTAVVVEASDGPEEYGALSDENSEFIAASRTAIPELCSALREQIKKNEEQSNVVRELVDCLRLYDLLGINAALDEGHAARALLAKLGISPDGGKDGED